MLPEASASNSGRKACWDSRTWTWLAAKTPGGCRQGLLKHSQWNAQWTLSLAAAVSSLQTAVIDEAQEGDKPSHPHKYNTVSPTPEKWQMQETEQFFHITVSHTKATASLESEEQQIQGAATPSSESNSVIGGKRKIAFHGLHTFPTWPWTIYQGWQQLSGGLSQPG